MLLERENELARIRAALDAAEAGDSSLLLITGPLGSGRSALLRRIPELAGDGTRVLRASAAWRERDFPFGIARQLFDHLLSGAGGAGPAERTAGAEHFSRLMDAGDRRTGTGSALEVSQAVLQGAQALLADASAERRLLILVDDLQWADGPSLRWLAHLTRRLYGLRALLVCTLAGGDHRGRYPLVREVAGAARTVLRLAPLSGDATRVLLAGPQGRPPQDALVRAVYEASRGNPLFLTAFRSALRATGRPPGGDHFGAVRELSPTVLRDRLAGHLRIQPQPVREVAVAVAALGDHSDPVLLAQLAGVDEIGFSGARRALVDAGLLARGRDIRFVHGVVRDAVDSLLTLDERERSHDDAADLLYRCGRPAEQVAGHLLAVVHPGRPWSEAVLRSAAHNALRAGRPADAARYLRRALLHHRTQDGCRARILIDLATAERALDPDACVRHVSQAVALLDTPRDRAAAVLRVPPSLLAAPSPSAVELVRQAAAGLDGPGQRDEEGADELALRLEAWLRHSGHENPVELASSVARLRRMGARPPVDSVAERELVAVLLCAGALSGRLSAAEIADTGNRILEREPATAAHAHTPLPLVMLALFVAESVQGVASWLASEQHTRRRYATGADDVLLTAERAFVLVTQGRPAAAREHVERALVMEAGDWSEPAVMMFAAVAFELRDPALSERVLERVRDRRPTGLALTATGQMLQAAVDVQFGRGRDALDTLLACGRRLETAGWRNSALLPWRPYAIGLHQRLGETDAALQLAEDELRWAREWGATTNLGRALRLKGWLLQDEGLDLLRESVETLRASSYATELARTLVVLGRRLPGGPEAEAVLREAAGIAAACGVPWLAERAEHGLGSAIVPPVATLTPSERRVASLVSRGLTNQAIATELGVSSRAVEKHLTSAYRKLGVSGRRELVNALPGR
ncbi:ATP-binding protein [Streptomyces sp. A1-5]|uniref:ATP-binding protein n=1 Tax=Streptomyces sp. A1-5 TaxID=2738410 RepID=UPI001F22306C|nr:LuxR family transcriptional regulator [Streptomyces sp. A1-5]UJB45799.1 AAA family ATPase [Streptomyces sp. A1-5]